MARFSRRSSGLAPWARAILFVIALVLLVAGLGLVGLGLWLVLLGGTFYYLLAGIGLAAAAVPMLRGFPGRGLAVYALVVAGTLAWALWEIAGKGFMPAWGVDLAGRVGVLAGLLGLALFVWLMGLPAQGSRIRQATLAGTVLVLLAAGGTLAWFWERPSGPPAGEQAEAGFPWEPFQAAPGLGRASLPNGPEEWLAFGGSHLGHRYTPADRITPANVSGLREVWRYRANDMPPSDRVYFSAQNTPLMIDGRLYGCSASNIVFALDPATGAEIWRFDPQVAPEHMESLFSVACRAVGYHERAEAPAEEACSRRIFGATADGRLIALDARDGSVCEGFGAGGVVDLSEGMGMQETGFASSTSGPAVVGDLILVGQQVSDNQRRDAPSGVVRAYDAADGRLVWAWDALRPDAMAPLAPGEVYPRGTPNVWGVIGADESLGLVYLGTGNSANDHYGADRTPEEDRFTSAIVAVELETGALRWDFATVDHDLWDYDVGAQPIVADLAIDGEPRRALILGTKTGSIFVFDAETGEPLRPIERRPAPQGGLPGERFSPDQPQSVFYPNFAGLPGPDPEVLDARHSFGMTPIDAALCRIEFHRMRYEGIFTPPTDEGLGMLLFPGTIGGLNWGGMALDQNRAILVTNHSRLPNRVTMVPRDEVTDLPVGDGGARPDQEVAPHAGSPWGVDRPIWLSPLGVPCIAPPWGHLAATDLESGEMLWTRPLGTGYDTGPLGLPSFLGVPMGTANVGGPMVTATGLTFIAAAQDNFLRAYHTATGRLLWRGRLPAGGQASPMGYIHEGRQYVLVTAAGHERLETTVGDYLVAFALEE